MQEINWDDFARVELRTGTIVEALAFPEARKPAYKIRVDFGIYGIKWSSAQVTKHYSLSDLPGRQIIGVLNFPSKKIAGFVSEFLITGFADEQGDIVLAGVERTVPNGALLI
jgi:tRNA-binding protein